MRQSQCTVSAWHVQQLFANLLTPILGRWDNGRCCTLDAVLAGVPGLRLVSDKRLPVRPGEFPVPGRSLSREAMPGQ